MLVVLGIVGLAPCVAIDPTTEQEVSTPSEQSANEGSPLVDGSSTTNHQRPITEVEKEFAEIDEQMRILNSLIGSRNSNPKIAEQVDRLREKYRQIKTRHAALAKQD